MSLLQWAASAGILLHVVALSVAALPGTPVPTNAEPLLPRQHALVRTVAPVLDRAAAATARIQDRLLALARPARALAGPYDRWGLGQKWLMFSQPSSQDQYLRIDYALASTAGDVRPVVRQLAMPAQHEGRPRLSHAFVDKAMLRSIQQYRAALASSDPSHARRFLTPLVAAHERRIPSSVRAQAIVRVEVWYGQVAIPPPGVQPPSPAARLAALEPYRSAALDYAEGPPAQLWERQREADITWQLVYVEWR